MLSDTCNCDVDQDGTDVEGSGSQLSCLVLAICVFVMCIPGCSRSAATQSEAQVSSPAPSVFSDMGKPSQCPAQCIPATVAIAREELGLDPKEQKQYAAAIFESLESERKDVGSTITRVPVSDVIEKAAEGPMTPVVLVHKTGHLHVLLGAIRINDKLLCQVIHGDEPVSLVTQQVLLEGGFQEAWLLEKKNGAGVPIYVGSTLIEIDKLRHNYGETLPDKSLECTFHLKNIGDKQVILDQPVVSCQCIVPQLGEKTKLAPGEALDLKVVAKATGSTSMRNSIGLVFYEQGSGASRHVQLSLIGSQRESMDVAPRTLDFGTMIPDKPRLRVVSLCEKPTDRFVVTGVDPGKLPIVYRITVTRNGNGLATYSVCLELKLDEGWSGEHREELRLTTDSYVRPRVTIPVVFQVEPAVRTMPSIISLGTIALGESREARVRFVARSGEPLAVQVESHPDECSIVLDQKKNPPEMIVAVKVNEPGIWQGTIKLNVRDSVRIESIKVKCVAYVSRRVG